ncbi:bone morphogenetic protein receptor type-2 [Anopheles cruzii]|uniref:bone morphogenetic protein receptor type-2 n=1 Tax=Anopheles cruzii TaxID=68878 RepID=UPI0022EC9050|nr:bone morphogenetic protein receptor type-2 [Anopheles cruzii]
MGKLISLGLVLMSVSLFATGQATPLKNRCYQYGTTSTTNTQQNGQEISDDYDESYDDQPEASDEPVFDKDVSTEVACSRNAPYCYSLWTFDETKNVTRVVAQGCWGSSDNHESCSDTECISTMETQNKLFFCCCSGDICNGNFSYAPPPTTLGGLREVDPGGISPYAPESSIWMAPTVYICFALVAIFLLGSVGIFRCRQRPKKGIAELEQMAPSGPGYSANLYNVDNLKLVSMIGQGKYGTVWKGIVNEQPVAVKIFAGQHRQYFLNERDIYTVALMESPSLLTYFGSDERRTMDDRVEFLLVLSLAPLGCLQDWLVDNRVPFGTFCRMGKSIANGLAHLHTEIRKGHLTKPCICHRDLNTRNILVKADLTCCIGDLGFALKTYGARYEYRGEITLAETKSINEVGTVRYMAPEVLEGAVNLRDCESALKQIDVYTLALVLWELAARCEDFYLPGTPVPEYRAPYEEYVGAHPTFEQMQVLVSRNKARPSFAPHFETSIAARIVRDTCEDCWDHDAEARLTAMCVQERLQEVAQLNPKAQVLVKEHYDDDAIIPPPGTGVKNVLYHQHLQENTGGTGGMGQQLQRYSPDGTTTFLTPPNQQILPPLVAVGGYRDDTTGSYGKLINGNSSHSTSSTSSTSSRRSAGNPNSDEDDDQKEHKHKKDLHITSDPTKRNLGLNTVKVMLQKTFHKPALHQQLAYETHGRDDSSDDRSNLVVVVEATEGSISVQQQFDSRVMPAEDEFGSLKRRPNNLDLGGSGRYESNLLVHDATTVDGQYAKLLSGAEFADHSLLTTMLVAGDGGEAGVALGDSLTEQKLRLVVSKSANAMHNTATTDRHGARLLAANVAAAESSEDSRALKRQRSLEVFHEVFAPKGSIERLRNPSQRVKTPGDVPPSVRKIRASKTLSLYDDRMMTVGPGSRLSNSV